MNEQEFISLFPEAEIHQQFPKTKSSIVLPLSLGRWIELDNKCITFIQQQAIRTYYDKETTSHLEHQPWYRYLILEKDFVQFECTKIQFIHIHLYQGKTFQKDILGIFQAFFPNLLAQCYMSDSNLIFILDQTVLTIDQEALSDITATIEIDFGVKMAVLVGQIWESAKSLLPKLFQIEHKLFYQWVKEYERSTCLLFSQLVLWGQRNAQGDILFLTTYLKQIIQNHEQLSDVIKMLWHEGAVLTKTAQNLYMHRNTLQYKLDRFYEQTGLSLKRMDDLALCYFVLMDSAF
ncbi:MULTISPECIES: helix-turn-helix domain-containing protein [unclassified Granulicatella]|uniref:helix-turn-helix domain-containing protein n=1 Tax=unclassified Granulicatella TaxID=2630493 RepID=UPI00107355FF|nr:MULTISPECIES: helix-turn-helix domain-containing protein [unclassified Granulicatella]MBF0779555.1 helix-turn-helix domain-containing protein [Granulicatella sp. 19428wC4_WM01]TFU96361.1 hypothetical protein E4T68_00460 [Granulicatella sp. WM01]